MVVPSPEELIELYGKLTPEQLAGALGFRVMHRDTPPALPGVTVFSEYQPERTIILYASTLSQLAETSQEPMQRLEQWHIAHELYHGLAEASGALPWRVRETEADLWADELLTLTPIS